jgi:hypothetical protein
MGPRYWPIMRTYITLFNINPFLSAVFEIPICTNLTNVGEYNSIPYAPFNRHQLADNKQFI